MFLQVFLCQIRCGLGQAYCTVVASFAPFHRMLNTKCVLSVDRCVVSRWLVGGASRFYEGDRCPLVTAQRSLSSLGGRLGGIRAARSGSFGLLSKVRSAYRDGFRYTRGVTQRPMSCFGGLLVATLGLLGGGIAGQSRLRGRAWEAL